MPSLQLKCPRLCPAASYFASTAACATGKLAACLLQSRCRLYFAGEPVQGLMRCISCSVLMHFFYVDLRYNFILSFEHREGRCSRFFTAFVAFSKQYKNIDRTGFEITRLSQKRRRTDVGRRASVIVAAPFLCSS